MSEFWTQLDLDYFRGLSRWKDNEWLVAVARYVPNAQLLSIPFRTELIHCAA
jgi:hypothetical protein